MKPNRILSLVLLLSLAVATGLSPLPPADELAASLDAPDHELIADSELAERRTAYSATYKTDTGYRAVISDTPLHYLDADGQWQPIDPAFRALADSYVVERNLIRGRAGAKRAWLSAAVGETALFWQASALGAADATGAFTPLATALVEPAAFAQQRPDGRALHYSGGWSDPTVGEAILSAPGSLEHALVLAAPLRANGAPQWLEMQATLRLLPGATLAADGHPVSGPVQSAETLEIRAADGRTALIFAPVRAFEETRPAVAVNGAYAVRPTDQPDAWLVSVRTPWAWWTDPARVYPTVLDPIITVQRPTGWGEGLAWVRSTGDKAYTLGELRLGAHLPDYNTESRGYVQFNSLPALLSNAPLQVTAAYLDVEPTDLFIPQYSYKGKGFTDWDSVTIGRQATLAYVGACPDDPACNDFSLHDDRLTDPGDYHWDNQPTAVDVGAQTLKVGPIKSAGNAKPTLTTWDVTAQIQSWYAAWFDQPNPRPGPTFQLRFSDTCPKAGPYVSGFVNGKAQFDSNLVPQCTHFYIPPGKVSLRIEYTELPLSLGDNLLNTPGVPSYTPLAGSSENLFLNPNHLYALAQPAGPARWRAVALRGNHDYDPVLPAWATLKLLDYTGVTSSGDEPVQLLNPKAQGPDQTTFFFVDDHLASSALDAADLRVEVVATADNDYAADQGRNYRLQYVQAGVLSTLIYGSPNPLNVTLFSDELIKLNEFHLVRGDNVGITVTAPISLEVALITPATGEGNAGALLSANHANVNYFSPAQPGSDVRTFSFSAPSTGEYALAVINQERPIFDPERQAALALSIHGNILACPEGSYPTAKYNCQPLRLPDSTVPPSRVVSAPGGGTLTVYSEGDFTPGADWCTTNESAGAPIIGPSVGGRWAAVVQGSVCYQGGVLSTTPDSAVGLIVATSVVNPTDQRGQIKPVPIYGDSMLLPAPGQPDGQVTLVSGGDLQPNADTIRRITPFEPFWNGYYAHNADAISTTDMQAHGDETVSTEVTVDAAGSAYPIDWSVAWALYPFTCSSCPVEWTFTDDPAVPSAAFPLELDLASTTLRMLNGGALNGQVRELDSYQKASGPVAFQFHNLTSRLTLDALLGGTTKPVHVVVQPPLWPRAAEGAGSCESGGVATSCLDLRRAEYNWEFLGDAEQNVSPWSLPDMHIETLPATVTFSRAGRLNVFSADHPNSAADFAQAFSFDTWEAEVRVAQEKCVDTDPSETTVIRGNGYVALPTLGDDGSGPPDTWIQVEFKLCETSLQQAHITFGIPKPGLPVGSTGVGVHLLDGAVTIDPTTGDTRITLGVGFETLDGYTLTDGKGTVTLDTAGMLSLQASGKLVGVVSADELRLDVAWNPLDVLFAGQVSYGAGLLTGNVNMHGWIGRGWQGKYAWLPDNDDFHFTGSIAASVKIKSGAVVDEWPFVLPPFTLSLTAEVAFGEFCTNASCTSYDWGMSATVKVLGYKVGVYVDGGGPDLILGSNSHKLIDQAGAAVVLAPSAMATEYNNEFRGFTESDDADLVNPHDSLSYSTNHPSSRHREIVPGQAELDLPTPILYPGANQINLTPPFSSPFDGLTPDTAAAACAGVGTSVVECPFTVNPGVGRALFTVSWENGDLGVALIKPDSTVITPANALAHGVVFSMTVPGLQHVVSFSAITPTTGAAIDSGVWKVRLDNVGQGLLPGFKNNYNLLFAADPPAAALEWDPPQELSPTQRRLTWTATRGGQPLNPDLEVELFAIPADQKPVTPTLMAGTAIVQKLSANAGLYDWDLSGLAAGSYAYGARIDDHATGNGHVVLWSPYTVTLTDATPPPVPIIAGSLGYTDTLIVYWLRDDATPDLAGYLAEYSVPDWDLSTPISQTRRVLPSKKSASPIVERARLGGLVLSVQQVISTTVCVRAYDASGNVSGCTPTVFVMPESPQSRLGPPEDLTLDSDGARITANWAPPSDPDLGGSLLDYRPVGCLQERPERTADEGPSPLVIGRTTTTDLTGLTPGQVYEVGVRGFRNSGEIGPRIFGRIMHIDPFDANADGIPDQWAEIYRLDPRNADLDGDGLLDAQEYEAASNPRRADSDGDGAYDAEEIEAGSDPCDPDDRPATEAPRLALVGDAALHFATAANLGPSEPQFISIFNSGDGALMWEASASAAWINLSPPNGSGVGTLSIAVNPAGWAAGVYSGTVTITNVSEPARASSGQTALAESVNIPVTLLVLPPKEQKLYLPLVQR